MSSGNPGAGGSCVAEHGFSLLSHGPLRWAILGAVWLCLMVLPSRMPVPILDPSWQAVLNYAAAHGFQYGVDIVFTYGPLGYLAQNQFGPGTWVQVLIFQALSRALYLAILWRIARPTSPTASGNRAGLIVFLCAAAILPATEYDSFYLLFITFSGLLLCRDSETGALEALAVAFLAVIGLVKFTYLLLASAILAVVILRCVIHRRPLAGLAVAALFASAFGVSWRILGGQRFAHLGAWLRGSLEIANGYSQGMGVLAPPNHYTCGILALVMVLAALVLMLRRSPGSLPAALIVLAGLGLAWKQGFIRGDEYHTRTFFAFVFTIFASLPFIARGLSLREGWTALMLGLSLGTVLAWRWPVPGFHAFQNARFLLQLPRANRLYSAHAQTYDLPEIRRLVGRATVDVVGEGQAVATLNGFNYHPPPVFQSYSAGTPYLARLNAEFYKSDRAPEFILWQPATVDDRLPNLDESISGLVIAQRYRRVASERGYALLQRQSDFKEPPGTASDGAVAIGRTFNAAAGDFVEVEMRENKLGRLARVLWMTPPVFVESRHANGLTATNRFIPSMGVSGFVVPPGVTALAVSKTSFTERLFDPVIHYRIRPGPPPVSSPQ